MSEYGKYSTIPSTPLLSHNPVAEKKAARRKLLAEVAQRRKENYKRYYRKMQLQASRILDTC